MQEISICSPNQGRLKSKMYPPALQQSNDYDIILKINNNNIALLSIPGLHFGTTISVYCVAMLLYKLND